MAISEQIKHIRSLLSRAMLKDKAWISKRLKDIQRSAEKENPTDPLLKQLVSLEKRAKSSVKQRAKRLDLIPDIDFPPNLPISEKAAEITQSIRENQVVIIAGDTGSGKSTQIPKMCLMAGQGVSGMIGCTQPRRIAAVTIARRIAEEIGEDVGKSVGYKIRFQDRIRRDSYIKIMTDGMLLSETQADPLLYDYDTIIIDEAHERSLNIDFLLGILRRLIKKRRDLKIIITSATMDTEKFSKGSDNAPVITVHGRMFPVEVRYMPPDTRSVERGDFTYVDTAVKAVERLARKDKPGDMLVFMPTEQDILDTCELLEARQFSSTTILPLFARLPYDKQARVFLSGPGKKIVVATNVAETSITIPGIRYVIDTGLARISRYVPRSRITSLPVSPVSISSADQRKGRCGRLEDGVCVRLYPEEDFQTREQFTPPEVLRANLAEVILRMIALGLGDIHSFPFLDRPDPRSVKDGFDLLSELGAIERKGRGVFLTRMGRIMARMPLDPKISRMLIEAEKESCVNEVAVIASVLSIQDPRVRPPENTAAADQKHTGFKDMDSDFITLLNIWNRFHSQLEYVKTRSRMRKYCRQNFLSYIRMREWIHIHRQITLILKEQKIGVGGRKSKDNSGLLYDRIHRSVLCGYLSNIALIKEKNLYQAARGREAMIFPGSTLFNRHPRWIVCAEMVMTSRLFARTVARIDCEWLETLGKGLCKYSYSDPRWSRSRGSVMASEQVSLYGLVIVAKRSVQYKRINLKVSHELFILSALVDGNIRDRFSFLNHNMRLIEKIRNMEDRIRRRGILVDDEAIEQFYSERLEGICDSAGLKRLIREKGGDDFLKLCEHDIIALAPDPDELSRFPGQMTMGGRQFDLAYRFAPGRDDDGVTLKVPSTMISRIKTEQLDWLVPGLFYEKVYALIKGLPKRYRKQLVPVSDRVDRIVAEMAPSPGKSLINCLGRFIYEHFNVDIPASEWPVEHIQDHLRLRVAVTDHRGKEIRAERDLSALRRPVSVDSTGVEETDPWKQARQRWERGKILEWDLGDLPERLELGAYLEAYPALVPEEEKGARICLFSNFEEAEDVHPKGVAALYQVSFKKDLKFLKKGLVLPQKLHRAAVYFGGHKLYEKALYDACIRHLFYVNIRTEKEFKEHEADIRSDMVGREKNTLLLGTRIIEAYMEIKSGLGAMESAKRSTSTDHSLVQEIQNELDLLIPQNFFDQYPFDRLEHIPRYIKALLIRARRGSVDPQKDRTKAAQIRPYISIYKEMNKGLSNYASSEKRAAVKEFGWMLEEFRVSLFAQELKTFFPVSEKRLKKRIEEIERMA